MTANQKVEIVRSMSEFTGMTQNACGLAYDAFINSVFEMLANRQEVTLNKIGTFKMVEKPSRRYVHPTNGLTYIIPARIEPRFKISNTLRNVLRKGERTKIEENV